MGFRIKNKNLERQCAICLDVIENDTRKVLQCGHQFHKDCIDEWFISKETCPICRAVSVDDFLLDVYQVFNDLTIEETVQLVQSLPWIVFHQSTEDDDTDNFELDEGGQVAAITRILSGEDSHPPEMHSVSNIESEI